MGEATGFLKWNRATPKRRPIPVRIADWREVYEPFPSGELNHQAGRCMDCGIPFCNNGCPLGNLIPDWNDLVYREHWREAIDRLHATNNFPEFTGRLCPAPCESACVLGINADPILNRLKWRSLTGLGEGWVVPQMPSMKSGKRVAVIGSGPTGSPRPATHACRCDVVVLGHDRIGGFASLRHTEFKMENAISVKDLTMEQEGPGTTNARWRQC